MALAPLAYVLYRRVLRHNPANPDWANRDRFVLSAGPRLHPPVRDPPPDRLQPLARGAEALPPVGVEDAGPPGALPHRGRRDDHRPARAGLRERRRLRDRRPVPRRALQPAPLRDRRPLRLRDLLRRRPDGGRLATRPPRSPATSASAGSSTSTTTTTSRSTAPPRSPSRPRTRRSASRRRAGTCSRSTTRRTSTRSSARSRAAQAEQEAPSLIIVRSHIAYGAPKAVDTAKSHGAPLGEEEVAAAKQALGLDPDKHFDVPDEVYEHMDMRPQGIESEQEWKQRFERWAEAFPGLKEEWDADRTGKPRPGWIEALPEFPAGEDGGQPRRRQEGDAGAEAVHADDGRRRGRPRRVDEDRVRGRRPLLEARTPAATSPSASASTRWARS